MQNAVDAGCPGAGRAKNQGKTRDSELGLAKHQPPHLRSKAWSTCTHNDNDNDMYLIFTGKHVAVPTKIVPYLKINTKLVCF